MAFTALLHKGPGFERQLIGDVVLFFKVWLRMIEYYHVLSANVKATGYSHYHTVQIILKVLHNSHSCI